ncbi:hypothetical protein EOA60_10485 [Mesorhizobium sp. M1A.F.Ca.IN.020.06.1.1]|nr:hypothetical protein EOA51_28930 [Mesorhizobium sp. M1A.F.Ca.IN.020.32.1.1]RUW06781.1 hypothetical protein EOA46_25230 [Mesorhizobium sp. M1A.F.Ca.IN.022.05.2.1]RUW31915.1 hypothetical protein EOA60_10485 [Mesorhizobium sp. M1A.F.Ca.IN.020.06.1.1]RWF75664.1 MAG: hypothetical protein EOQ35_28235 [Mesorhizobium sp.]RWF95456.1 MAG: hypothetical protein EOQ38_26470 [Mesorhizobium sp.]
MMRGGARKGAGRPRGAATKKTRAIADRESKKGITPLEVMLTAMREHAAKKNWDAAASFAKDAAPYMHAKLQAVQHSGPAGGPIPIDLTNLGPDDLQRLEALFGNLAGLAGDDAEADT